MPWSAFTIAHNGPHWVGLAAETDPNAGWMAFKVAGTITR